MSSPHTAPPETARNLSWFSRLPLRYKLGSIGLVAVVVMFGNTVIMWSGINTLHENSAKVSQAKDVVMIAAALDELSAEGKVAQNSYITDVYTYGGPLAATPQAPRRANFLALMSQISQRLETFPTAGVTEEEKAALAEVKKKFAEFQQLDQTAASQYAKGDKESLAAGDGTIRGSVRGFTMMRERLQDLVASSQQRADAAAVDQDHTVSRLKLWAVLALLASVLLTGVIAMVISRRVLVAIRVVRASMTALRQRDLSVECQPNTGDELGELAIDTELTRQEIRRLISEMGATSRAVASASEQVLGASREVESDAQHGSAAASEISETAEGVGHRMHTVSAGTEQMSASIREIAKNANSAAEVAASAVGVAQETNAIVTKLGDSSAEIGQVIRVITSIAEQTNLLALNATIEAARAGDAGKGFAVVANEVKELAQETAKATDDITHRIEQIQLDTAAAVTAIGQISEVIATINDTQTTIASAVEQQTATSNEMARNIAGMATSADVITRNASQSSSGYEATIQKAATATSAADELHGHARRLQELVDAYQS